MTNKIDWTSILNAAQSELPEEQLPSAKQINFAKELAEILELKLPEKKTKAAYIKFISDHIEEYKGVIKECGDCWFEELGG